MKLSICTPSIPSRLAVHLLPLIHKIDRQIVMINNVGPFPLIFRLGHKHNEEPNLNGFTRPPWHPCAWRASTSYHIDSFLCTYRFNEAVTEAR